MRLLLIRGSYYYFIIGYHTLRLITILFLRQPYSMLIFSDTWMCLKIYVWLSVLLSKIIINAWNVPDNLGPNYHFVLLVPRPWMLFSTVIQQLPETYFIPSFIFLLQAHPVKFASAFRMHEFLHIIQSNHKKMSF